MAEQMSPANAGVRQSWESSKAVVKKTVWFGTSKVVDALKKFGPAELEIRAQKILEEKIIPKASPEWKARLEKHKGAIAKTTAWVATAAEVSVVAGVTYGGVRLIAKKFGERHMARSVSPKLLGEGVIKPKMADIIDPTSEAFWSPTTHVEEKLPDWLVSLGAGVTVREPVKRLKKPMPVRRPTIITVSANDVPDSLRNLSPFDKKPHVYTSNRIKELLHPTSRVITPLSSVDVPPFIENAMATRQISRTSEKVAGIIDRANPQGWWQDRKAAGLDRSPKRTLIGAKVRKRISSMPLIKDLSVHERLYFDRQRVGEITKRMGVRKPTGSGEGVASVVDVPAVSLVDKWKGERDRLHQRKHDEMMADYDKRRTEQYERAFQKQAENAQKQKIKEAQDVNKLINTVIKNTEDAARERQASSVVTPVQNVTASEISTMSIDDIRKKYGDPLWQKKVDQMNADHERRSAEQREKGIATRTAREAQEALGKVAKETSEKDVWNSRIDAALTEVQETIRTTPRLFINEAYKAVDSPHAHHQTEQFLADVLANVQVLHRKTLSKSKVSQLVSAVQNASEDQKVAMAKNLMQYGFDKLPKDVKERLTRQQMGKPRMDGFAREWVNTLKTVGIDVL